MAVLEDTFAESLTAIRSATGALPTSVEAVRPLADASLLALQREFASVRRALDASASLVAGEIEHRSRRELGYAGLAQREGYRTPERLVQHITGSTARDASALVQVGTLLHGADDAQADGPAAEVRQPWLTAVGTAVAAGWLGVQAAQAIRTGLGEPTESVTAESLAAAVDTLLLAARELHADELFTSARRLRDDLDIAGVALREKQLHEQRGIRRVRRPNGTSRYIIDADLMSGAFWDDTYDTLTSPRRGGVSFVDEGDRAWADAVVADERTTEQYLFDCITQLLQIGTVAGTVDSRRIIGSRQPAVRVLVTAEALQARAGLARIEGVDIPISIATAEQVACGAGTIPLLFDDTDPLDVGREQRFFTPRQRIALAARDGGCMFPGCDRPPSWCEGHHIKHWDRDAGPTDVADGILLCRHHHMLIHNNGWEITRDDAGFRLIPPRDIDPEQTPRPMHSKSAALRDLLATRRSGVPDRPNDPDGG